MVDNLFPVQFISHYNDRYDYVEGIEESLQGGCKWIQLRVKYDVERYSIAKYVLDICHKNNAKLIIDDDVNLVKSIGADGVHLGKKDMPISDARQILGDDFIIGGTANTIDDIRNLYLENVDYIGCGPFRYTTTKQGLSPIIGLQGYKDIVSIMEKERIDVPLVAIGGITIDDILQLKEVGIKNIAISSWILNSENPSDMMRKLIELITKKI